MILVSVIVATHRRDDELKRALLSLSRQSYTDIEIIIVDDNGDTAWNKKVATIVNDFKASFPDIALRYFVNEFNKGSAETRNIGIAAANGEYITFLDDDDVYLPDKIKAQLKFMVEGNYDYSITDLILYNNDEKAIDKRFRYYIKDTSPKNLRMYHLKYHMTGTDTIMFKKDYLVGIGGFAPINVGDEFYLIGRAIDAEGKFGYLPRCDVKAYIHTGDGGLSSGDGKIKGENALYEYKRSFFNCIDAKTKRYIRMRHYAVIAFAEMRRRHIFSFIVNAAKAFMCSPIQCVMMLLSRKGLN